MKNLIRGITSLVFLSSMALQSAELDVTVTDFPIFYYVDLSAQNKITLSNSASTCAQLGGIVKIKIADNMINTNGRSAMYYLSMQNRAVIAEEVCVGHSAAYKIYKTNVKGIGISFNDADSGSQSNGKSIPLWPKVLPKRAYSGSAVKIGLWVGIRLWKYSSSANTLSPGMLVVYGPAVIQGVGPVVGDTLHSCSSERASAEGTDICYTDRRIPRYSTSLYSSTCEFVNASKTVQMGTHNMHSSTAQGAGTPWVDASFQLRCSNAWGYGADTTDLNNLTKNNTVKVTVHPLDGFSNANQGIIKLDGSGAQGVGVQLAWGDYSTQGTTPGNPVKLDTPTDANTLSSNFAAGPYAIGGNAVSGDGSIKMAARFIRTSGTFSPGQANAKVEILANYQ